MIDAMIHVLIHAMIHVLIHAMIDAMIHVFSLLCYMMTQVRGR